MPTDWFSPISRYVFNPLYAYRDGSTVYKWLAELEKNQYLKREDLERLQWNRLARLLAHAYANCSYYRETFDKAGIDIARIADREAYSRVPLLTKADIQNNLAGLTARNLPQKQLIADKTGGSTGKPLNYFHDQDRVFSMQAEAIRHDRWAGKQVGDKIAGLWGARHDWSALQSMKAQLRNALSSRMLVLDASSLTDAKMVHFIEQLERYRPKGILAYANALALFAEFVKQQGVRGLTFDTIITSAEVLRDEDRALIEEVFQTKVFDRYGCREVAVIASECERHRGMHIAADCLLLEVVKPDGTPAAYGEEGDIVITDLLNVGMPFIRYKIEDVGILSDRHCECGRTLPMLEKVNGRTTDFLITPDNVKVSGASLTIYLIASTPGIRQAQLIQTEADRIVLKIVKGTQFSDATQAALEEKLPGFFGNKMRYEFQFVDDIPKTASGKYLFSINQLKKANPVHDRSAAN